MKTDLLIALRARWVQVTLFISLLVRLVFLNFYLPEKPSEFGPDEGSYAQLAGYVAQGLPVEKFPGWGPGLYNSSRSLIVPSSTLVRFGLSDLEAVRITSSFYGLLSSLLIVICLVAILRESTSQLDFKNCGLKIQIPVIFFTFLPSNFLWSNLGLRESSSQFWLIATFYFLLKLYLEEGKKLHAYFALSSLSLVFAFGARKETALVFAISALVMGLYLIIAKRNVRMVAAVTLGLLGGQMFITSLQVKAIEIYYLLPEKELNSKSPSPTQSVESKSPSPNIKAPLGLCKSDQSKIRIGSNVFTCTKEVEYTEEISNPIMSTKIQLSTVKALEEKRRIQAVNAQSALPISNCKTYSNQIQTLLFCNLKDLPYRLSSFLLRPFPLIESGSAFFKIAGLENIVWLLLYLLVFYLFLTTQATQVEKFIKISLMFYFVSFSTLASLYEGNLGTAFRHKSSMLWPLIMILAILLLKERTLRTWLAINHDVASKRR